MNTQPERPIKCERASMQPARLLCALEVSRQRTYEAQSLQMSNVILKRERERARIVFAKPYSHM